VSEALCAAGGKEQFEASEQMKHGLAVIISTQSAGAAKTGKAH